MWRVGAAAVLAMVGAGCSPPKGTESAVDSGGTGDTAPAWMPDMAEAPGGTFEMGCTAGQDQCGADETEHSVILTRAYLVGVTEVTQAQFQAGSGLNPSHFQECAGGDEDCPVEEVTWDLAAAFANAASDAAGLAECYACVGDGESVSCAPAIGPYACFGYRLPTEAEWEGAARCGTDLRYAGSDDSLAVAWTEENSYAATHVVSGLHANACALYDMSGNVWEWTQDWYAEYPSGPVTDPEGPETGSSRVYRGGSWYGDASAARVSIRATDPDPAHADSILGFRLARSMPDP